MSRKGRNAAPAIYAAKLKTWGRFAPLSRHNAAQKRVRTCGRIFLMHIKKGPGLRRHNDGTLPILFPLNSEKTCPWVPGLAMFP